MQAGRRRGSGDVTHWFFPAGRSFLANRFAGWSVPEGTAGRGRPAGRGQSPQAGFRQRPGRAGSAGRDRGEPGSLAGQRRLQLAEETRQDPASIRASIPGRRAGNCARGQHGLAPRAAGTGHRPPGPSGCGGDTAGVVRPGWGLPEGRGDGICSKSS